MVFGQHLAADHAVRSCNMVGITVLPNHMQETAMSAPWARAHLNSAARIGYDRKISRILAAPG